MIEGVTPSVSRSMIQLYRSPTLRWMADKGPEDVHCLAEKSSPGSPGGGNQTRLVHPRWPYFSK